MRMEAILTVAESKRLIAKGIAKHPAVQAARTSGFVAVAKGTTNAYVVEELLGRGIDKCQYVLGAVQPARSKVKIGGNWPDLVLKDGKVVEGATVKDTIQQMGPGDVFIKGANALNYAARVAGILIGHPTGGTIGSTLGCVIARRIHFIIPVGLEKNIVTDIRAAHRVLADVEESRGHVPALWPVEGEIFTEIEALEVLAGVQAIQIGAGGVGGAEGAVRLLLWGSDEEIEQAARLVESIQDEPLFGEVR